MGQFLIVVVGFKKSFHVPQHHCREHIGRNQITVLAGVVTGTEAGPGHTGISGFASFSISAQRICRRTVQTLEGISGIALVILLGFPQLQDLAQGFFHSFIKNGRILYRRFVLFQQPYRIAQGIDLVFPLPVPGVAVRDILLPAVSVGPFIERVGIGVNTNAAHLTADQPPHQIPENLVVFQKGQVMHHLGGGISQPHGADITGKYVCLIIFQKFCGCLCRADKAVLKHPFQLIAAIQLLCRAAGNLLYGFHQFFQFFFVVHRVTSLLSFDSIFRRTTARPAGYTVPFCLLLPYHIFGQNNSLFWQIA